MSRLFWRIFGGFWLLLLALTGATLAINYFAMGTQASFEPPNPFFHAGFGFPIASQPLPLPPMMSGPEVNENGFASGGTPDRPLSWMHPIHNPLHPQGFGDLGQFRGPDVDPGVGFGSLLIDVGGLLNNQGVPGVERFFTSVKRMHGPSFSLFDSKARFVCGKTPTRASQSLVWQAIQSNHPQMIFEHNEMLHASPFVDNNGDKYVLVDSLAPPAADWPAIVARAFGALLIATLMCWWLTAQITRPVHVLRGAARDIASGNLSIRTAPQLKDRKDEIGLLGQDFDRMAVQLEKLITAHIRLMADISHELRSPLARLTLASAVARRATGEEVGSCLDRVDQETERLNELIGQLTALCQLDLQQTHANCQVVDVIDLIKSVIKATSYEADEKGSVIALLTENPDEVLVTGDCELLLRAVENVIRNAVRYTVSGTIVTVQVITCEADGLVQIITTDCGSGVPPDELDAIFNPFYRTSLARDRETGGVGLGLTIAKRAVLHHHGSIRASNRRDGVSGLEVCITLPCSIGESQLSSTAQFTEAPAVGALFTA